MADLKAPPQNEWLAKLAEMLRAGRDTANKVSLPQVTKALPVIGPMLNNGPLGDTAFGRSPEGVEQMSYGEAPITLPTLAKPMGFPKNEEGGLRAMDQLEALGTMPAAAPLSSAKTASSTAIMMPYIKGAKGIEGLQNPVFDKAAKKAVEMLRSGKTPTETGQETGMWVVPRGGARSDLDKMDPDNAMFMVEIPDSKMQLKPMFRGITKPGNNTIRRGGKLDEVLEFDNGFKLAPHLRDMKVSFSPSDTQAGAYNFPTGTIKLNPYTAGSDEELLGWLNHELQHGMQYHTNNLKKFELSMPPGGSPEAFKRFGDSDARMLAGEARDALDKYPSAQFSKNPNDVSKLAKFLRSYDHSLEDPVRGYNRLLGEQQAEASRKRMRLTRDERLDKAPYEDYTMGHPFKGAEGTDMRDIAEVYDLLKAQPYVYPPDYGANILSILRKPRLPPK